MLNAVQLPGVPLQTVEGYPVPNTETTELLTSEELAVRLKVHPQTVRNWASRGTIPAVRITRRVRRFDLAAVMRALGVGAPEGRETEPTSATAEAGS